LSDEQFEALPELRYLKQLLSDSKGSVEIAMAIHFGANDGCVPKLFYDQHERLSDEPDEKAALKRSSPSLWDPPHVSSATPLDGMSFVVYGGDSLFTRFGSRARAEGRLKEVYDIFLCELALEILSS